MENKEVPRTQLVEAGSTHGTTSALKSAAVSCVAAAAACRAWEAGGDETAVTDSAAAVRKAANIALEAVVSDQPWDRSCDEPANSRTRLAYAAWFALLAGTDEHGAPSDLDCATQLFRAAAAA